MALSPVEQVVYNYVSIPKVGSEFKSADMEFAMEKPYNPFIVN